ncbi:hypothetical protein C7B09_14015 [Escherichia albertii]|uniref:DUF1795 domain-containing protein n=2 Tax=Escherichia albertii TaxID=208962 RepID=A0ABX5HH43_ESCAL|nr:hypothetical protein [Escherichia albertii]PSY41338.1 hypothetical protein C7B09_14015 [Escherichia albertii]
MRYVILFILWIITFFLSHLQHSNLLAGDPGMVGEYIGSVFLGPLLLPVLVSGILCAFTKKTRNFASFTRGCGWVLGVLLLSNIGNMFRMFTPWQYTFQNAAISVTVPNRHWNTVSISTDKTIDIRSEDNSVFISAFRLPAGRSADDSLEELKKMQRDNLKDQYNEETFQFHDCNAKHFTCKYQDVLITFDGQQKRTISIYLEDTPRAVGLIALMEPDTSEKYRQQAMEIMLSAQNTRK